MRPAFQHPYNYLEKWIKNFQHERETELTFFLNGLFFVLEGEGIKRTRVLLCTRKPKIKVPRIQRQPCKQILVGSP